MTEGIGRDNGPDHELGRLFHYAAQARASTVTPASDVVPTAPTAFTARAVQTLPPPGRPPLHRAGDSRKRSRGGQHRREEPGGRPVFFVLNTRFITFGIIGASVFAMGLVLQILLV